MQIKFGTDGWRAIIAQEFTVQNVARVTAATAEWVKSISQQPSVVIGYDCRFGGQLFAETASKVFAAHGVKVYLGQSFVTTPMVSLCTLQRKASAGVVITASHNPPAYNGYKLKAAFGGPASPAEIAKVEIMIPDSCEVPSTSLADIEKNGLLEYIDMESAYVDYVKSKFDLVAMQNTDGVLVYDAMMGAGQRVFPRILPNAKLLRCEYNPSFLGQAPEPLEKNSKGTQSFIRTSKEKLLGALVTDGDADRIGMYDEKGNFLDAHHILLLLIYYAHAFKKMNGKVVIAFSVSDKIKKLCRHYNLPVEVTKIGFKYIADIMMKADVLVGGEESGGIAVKGHIPERDGIWDGLLLMELMAKTGKTLTEIIEQDIYPIVGKFVYERNDLHLDESLKQAIMANCKNGNYKTFGSYSVERVEDIDGYKFHLPNECWVMIRASGTEPLLRVYAEAPSHAMVLDILEQVKTTLLG